MQKQHDPIIKVSSFDHIGIIVKDLNQSMREMWNNFGIGPWKIYIYEPGQIQDAKYYGKPSSPGAKVAIAKIGPTLMELIEPIGAEKDSIYYKFIKEYGEGIQHLGHHRVATEDDFLATVKKLEMAGFPCIFSGLTPMGNRVAYMDTRKTLYTILEILWTDQTLPILKPNSVFPE